MRRAAISTAGTVALLVAALPASAAHTDNASPNRTAAPPPAAGSPVWGAPARHGSDGVRAVEWKSFTDMVVKRRGVSFDFVYSAFVIVPDLDGDHRDDVVDVLGRSGSSGDSTQLTARRGADGRVLWHKTSTTLDFPVSARVGPKAVNGLYSFSFASTDAVAGFAGTLGVSAIDNTGKTLWSKSFNGGDAGLLVADAGVLPEPMSVAPINADAADDLVLVTQADAYSLVDEHHVAQIEVLSGSDGASVSKVGPLATMSGFDLPVAVSDVTGDKRADLMAVELDPATQLGKISLFRGTDGTRLWSSSPEYYEPFAMSVGDMTGDGRADFIAYTISDRTRLLNGATGATVWTRAGAQVLPLGDVNGDRRQEVALLSYSGFASGVTMTMAVVDGNNATRWSRTVSVGHSGAQVYAWFAGDLQGDGVQDLLVTADYRNQNAESTHHYTVDGRSGRIVRDHLAKGAYGAFGAIDGRGDDVLVGSVTKADRALVLARSGDTDRKLWAWNGPVGLDPPTGFAYDLSGDHHAEVLLFNRSDDGSATVTVLDGRSGKQRWRT